MEPLGVSPDCNGLALIVGTVKGPPGAGDADVRGGLYQGECGAIRLAILS